MDVNTTPQDSQVETITPATATSTGTNLGPLTTVFTGLPSCTYVFETTSFAYSDYVAQTCTAGNLADAQACWPSPTATVESTEGALNGRGYYSPGLVCPSGWYSACSATAAATADNSQVSGDFTFQFALSSGVTAVGCCPSEYICTYDTETHQSCMKTLTSASTFTAATCMGGVNTYASYIRTTSSIQIWAPMIELVYQSSDLSLNTTATITPSTSPATATATHSSVNGGSTLSAKGKIAVGVGVTVAVLVAITLGLVVFWRRRRNKKTVPVDIADTNASLELSGGP